MSMRYSAGSMNGLYLDASEATAFYKRFSEVNPLDDDYDEVEDAVVEEYGAIKVNDSGDEGWFTGFFATAHAEIECTEGDLILPISFQGTWLAILSGNQSITWTDLVAECRENYGKYLPEDFPYEERIGIFCGCFFG